MCNVQIDMARTTVGIIILIKNRFYHCVCVTDRLTFGDRLMDTARQL